MFHRSTFVSPLPTPVSGQPLKAVLFMSLLLVLFLSGCKSASTPTQTQVPAQPQGQSAEPQVHDQAQQSTYPATDTPSPARSDEEIIGDFDAELDASIAVFDGMILDERAKAETIEASLGGGQEGGEQGGGELGGGSGGDGSLFEDGDIYEGLPGYGEFPESADQGEEGSAAQQASYEGESSTASGDASSSESAAGGSSEATAEGSVASPSGLETTRRGGIPEDIEGGSDDDIVARQIREAALKEKDPALREKLWDEYRKYKNQQ